MESIGTRLDRSKGFGHGFDFLRVFFAVSIVAWHCVYLAGSRAAMLDSAFWFAGYALVPMFFMLSGFLVAGSAMRLDLRNFIINRVLRIVPALAVDVGLSALILGPIFTTLTLRAYFGDWDFWEYFLNIFGRVQYDLPGVFQANVASNRVNGALWTVPYEIGCYILMSGLMLLGWLRFPRLVAAASIALLLAAVAVDLSGIVAHMGRLPGKLLTFLFLDRGAVLLPAFTLGILGYQLRHRIPYDWRLAAAGLAICLGVALLGNQGLDRPLTHLFLMPVLAYLVIFFGITRFPKLPYFSTGDYSYGIYLYHYPIAQALIALFPNAWDIRLLHVVATLALVTLFATFSWHCIEKPVLGLRKRFAFANSMRTGVEPSPQPAEESKLQTALRAAP